MPVGTGAQVDGAVVLDVSTRAARESIRTSWLVIVAGALVALAAVTAVAIALSRWTVRPLGALTARVGALTDAVPSPRPRVRRSTGRPSGRYSGPPEVQELAKAFDTMSGAVQASGQAQRQLIADTAHQLRNPLAALHIRLDSLGPHVAEAGAETYRRTGMEVDRLGGILDGLLALAVAESPAVTTPTPSRTSRRTAGATSVPSSRTVPTPGRRPSGNRRWTSCSGNRPNRWSPTSGRVTCRRSWTSC